MTTLLALTIGVLFGTGTFLLVRRNALKVIIGLSLISHGANVLLVTSGGFGGNYPRLYRLLDFAEGSDVSDVPDPYYTGNFEYVYELVEEGCRGLLAFIREQENI